MHFTKTPSFMKNEEGLIALKNKYSSRKPGSEFMLNEEPVADMSKDLFSY